MNKIILTLAFIPCLIQAQTDVTLKNEYAEIIVNDTLYLSGYFENHRIESPYNITKYSDLSGLSVDLYPEYPETGTEVKKNELYNYNGEIVQVVQDHKITHYNPHDVPNLFSFYRPNSDDLLWMPNEQVVVGWVRVFAGISYECIQTHMTLASWQPPNVLGVLWVEMSTASDCDDAKAWVSTDHWTTYKLGDLRVNAGKLWEVINVGFTYYEPSGPYGHYGWKYLQDCP
jgi:hypothetical protein